MPCHKLLHANNTLSLDTQGQQGETIQQLLECIVECGKLVAPNGEPVDWVVFFNRGTGGEDAIDALDMIAAKLSITRQTLIRMQRDDPVYGDIYRAIETPADKLPDTSLP